MQIFIGLAQLAVCALLLLGCSQSVQSNETLQEKNSVTHSQTSALWHDGSTGGAYGIGEGWIIEILPAEYETFIESIILPQMSTELLTIPATFKWVDEDSEAFKTYQKNVIEVVTIPAKYEIITTNEEVRPARTEYYLAKPIHDSIGTVKTLGTIKERHVPPVTKDVSRRVVKVPARSEERVIPNVPIVRRDGYVRIVKTPAKIMPRDLPDLVKTETRKRMKFPQRFAVKRPDGEIAHVFDKYEDLTAFVNSFN